MFERIMARLGYVRAAVLQEAVEQQTAALEAAWVEADRERARRAVAEDRFTDEYMASPDGLADQLDSLTGRLPVVLAAHAEVVS